MPGHRLLPRGVMVLVGVASSVVALAGIKAAAGIVTPVFIALLVVVAVEPLHRWGARHRLPRWLSALVALLGAYLLIVGLVVALMVTLGRFAGSLPGYASDLQNLLNALAERLRGLGIASEHAREILESFAPQQLLALVNRLLSDGFLLSSNLLLILTLLLFIAMDAVHLPAFVEEARTKHPGVVAALDCFAADTRRYLVASTVFGAIAAAIDTALLVALGVPAALLWGLLAFVSNYIPIIGMVVGLIPPAILALLQGGPWVMLCVVAGYCVVNFVIQSLIQPRFVADAVDVSPTVSMLSVLFWVWVLGPPGALLAIPLTLLVKALVVDVDEDSASLLRPLFGASETATRRASLDESRSPRHPSV